jgi:hypothetical protein
MITPAAAPVGALSERSLSARIRRLQARHDAPGAKLAFSLFGPRSKQGDELRIWAHR